MQKDPSELNSYIAQLCATVTDQYSIPERYYRGGAVKRGLRNADGTGVMAGVTCIGSVQGY
jgi:citrate synthase